MDGPGGGRMKSDSIPTLKRRELLASASVIGVGSMGLVRGRWTVSASDRPYTNYTYASSNGIDLVVGWYSTYNRGAGDEFVSGLPLTEDAEWAETETDAYVSDPTNVAGPVIEIDNALPGDSGTLSVGLSLDPDSEPATVWMRQRLAAGENMLADTVAIELWYDHGPLGIGSCLGAENGSTGDPIVTGTLEHTRQDIIGGVSLQDGFQINPGMTDNSCLDPDARYCLGFAWELPNGLPNTLQGTGVGFALDFVAVPCDFTDNPFTHGVGNE